MGYSRNDVWMTCGERDDKCKEIELSEYADPFSEIVRLRAIIEKYARHDENCQVEFWHGKGPMRCSCGYYEALYPDEVTNE